MTKAQEGRGLFIGPPVWCGSILQGESDGSLAVVPEPTTRPGIWVVQLWESFPSLFLFLFP